MRQPPSARGVTEKASSISVVEASSIENAAPRRAAARWGARAPRGRGRRCPPGSARRGSGCSGSRSSTRARRRPAAGARPTARCRRRRPRGPWSRGGCGRGGRAAAAAGGELGRQAAGDELGAHALDRGGLLALLLEAGERGLEDVGGGLAEAPAALAVEPDRRRVQAQQQGGRFDRGGCAALVFGGEVGEGEFVLAADFPEELDVQAFGLGLGAREQVGRAGLAEFHQHMGALELHPLAVGVLDLQRGVVIGEDGPGLEGPVLFIQHEHRHPPEESKRASLLDSGRRPYRGVRMRGDGGRRAVRRNSGLARLRSGRGAGVVGAACRRGPSRRSGLPSVEDAAGAATQTRRCAPRTCVALFPPRRPPPRRS
jgi:hypothetical protein